MRIDIRYLYGETCLGTGLCFAPTSIMCDQLCASNGCNRKQIIQILMMKKIHAKHWVYFLSLDHHQSIQKHETPTSNKSPSESVIVLVPTNRSTDVMLFTITYSPLCSYCLNDTIMIWWPDYTKAQALWDLNCNDTAALWSLKLWPYDHIL